MASSLILTGLGLAAVGFAGRYAARRMPAAAKRMEESLRTMPSLDASKAWSSSKYYRGGFDAKMNRREAALILGVSPNAPA